TLRQIPQLSELSQLSRLYELSKLITCFRIILFAPYIWYWMRKGIFIVLYLYVEVNYPVVFGKGVRPIPLCPRRGMEQCAVPMVSPWAIHLCPDRIGFDYFSRSTVFGHPFNSIIF